MNQTHHATGDRTDTEPIASTAAFPPGRDEGRSVPVLDLRRHARDRDARRPSLLLPDSRRYGIDLTAAVAAGIRGEPLQLDLSVESGRSKRDQCAKRTQCAACATGTTPPHAASLAIADHPAFPFALLMHPLALPLPPGRDQVFQVDAGDEEDDGDTDQSGRRPGDGNVNWGRPDWIPPELKIVDVEATRQVPGEASMGSVNKQGIKKIWIENVLEKSVGTNWFYQDWLHEAVAVSATTVYGCGNPIETGDIDNSAALATFSLFTELWAMVVNNPGAASWKSSGFKSMCDYLRREWANRAKLHIDNPKYAGSEELYRAGNFLWLCCLRDPSVVGKRFYAKVVGDENNKKVCMYLNLRCLDAPPTITKHDAEGNPIPPPPVPPPPPAASIAGPFRVVDGECPLPDTVPGSTWVNPWPRRPLANQSRYPGGASGEWEIE